MIRARPPTPRPASRRDRLALLVSVAALAGLAGFGLGWWLKPAGRLNAVAYGGERVHVINAHLRQVRPPYGFLAGDSLVEHYLPETLPCGRELVNGGVNGAKVADYLGLLPRLEFGARPAVVLLSTGLNDLLHKHDPTSPAALERFRSDVERLVGQLGRGGTKVVVAAIPPVSAELAKYFDTGAFRVYSDALRGLCGRLGCTFVDPFAAFRTDAFWTTVPGGSRDGLHLTDLRTAYRSVADALCR